MWCFVEKIDNQDPFELSYDTAGELIYLWGKTLQFYTAGLANGKQIASGGPYEHVPGHVLICSGKDTTSGTAAAIEVTTWLSFHQSTVILDDPSAFFTGQIGELKGDMGGTTTPASFKSLMVALINAVPPGMPY